MTHRNAMDQGSPVLDDSLDLRKTSVVFVNRSYWPDGGATGQLLTQLCESLTDEFQVTVVCAHPSMLPDGVRYENKPREIRNGVTIRRVAHTRLGKSSSLRRLIDMLTFMVSATWTLLRMPKPDVLVTETDPPFLCLLGALTKRLKGVRLVCYLQDIYPDVVVSVGKIKEGWISRGLRSLFRRAYRSSSRVIVLSRDMLQQMSAVWGIERSMLTCIRNWTDTKAIYPCKENNRFRHVHGLEEKFVVAYSGNMGLTQPIEDLLDAAQLLLPCTDISFVLSGKGARCESMKRRAEDQKLTNLEFHDFQPYDALADSLSAADVHIVFLDPRHERVLMPSKIYGVLASGSAVIVVGSAASELASICIENDLGAVVPVGAPETLAEQIALLQEDPQNVKAMGLRARDYAEQYCGIDVATAEFQRLFDELVPQHRPTVKERREFNDKVTALLP